MRIRAVLLLVVGLAVLSVPAVGATRNGITPTAPKAGADVPSGKAVTFRGRSRGNGPIYVHVCKSRKKDSKGVICDAEVVVKAKRTGRRFRAKPRYFDFPSFWLNQPGRYFWQAYRIRCEAGNTADCLQEGPITRFRVAG